MKVEQDTLYVSVYRYARVSVDKARWSLEADDSTVLRYSDCLRFYVCVKWYPPATPQRYAVLTSWFASRLRLFDGRMSCCCLFSQPAKWKMKNKIKQDPSCISKHFFNNQRIQHVPLSIIKLLLNGHVVHIQSHCYDQTVNCHLKTDLKISAWRLPIESLSIIHGPATTILFMFYFLFMLDRNKSNALRNYRAGAIPGTHWPMHRW